jgi:hypothetical protein
LKARQLLTDHGTNTMQIMNSNTRAGCIPLVNSCPHLYAIRAAWKRGRCSPITRWLNCLAASPLPLPPAVAAAVAVCCSKAS